MSGEPPTQLPPDDTTHLRDFLASRDFPCPTCSYSLRGNTTPRCPECSAPLSLTLQRTADRPAMRLSILSIGLYIAFYGLTAVQWARYWAMGGLSSGWPIWIHLLALILEFVGLVVVLTVIIARARRPDPGRAAMSLALKTVTAIAALNLAQSALLMLTGWL